MSLETRLSKLEKQWYSLEAEYYGAHWQELYEADSNVLNAREELDRLVLACEPPFWFWPGSDDWTRKFGWAMTHKNPAAALFDQMYSRLRKLVDQSALSDTNQS